MTKSLVGLGFGRKRRKMNNITGQQEKPYANFVNNDKPLKWDLLRTIFDGYFEFNSFEFPIIFEESYVLFCLKVLFCISIGCYEMTSWPVL